MKTLGNVYLDTISRLKVVPSKPRGECVCGGRGYVREVGEDIITGAPVVVGRECPCLEDCTCDGGTVYREMDGYDFAEDCQRCATKRRAARFVGLSGVPPMYVDATASGMDLDGLGLREAVRRLVGWVREYRTGARGWTLMSPGTGTGKTRVMASVVWALIDRGVMVRWIGLAEYLQELRLLDKREADVKRQGARMAHVLAIDELGGIRTEWELQETAELLSMRYNRGGTTLVTTNLTRVQIERLLGVHGQRIVSRMDEMCPEIEVDGRDHRRVK